MTDDITKYAPSNANSGDVFMSKFCFKCQLVDNEKGDPCPILGLTMALDVDDPDYPSEWCLDADGQPTCTAFVHHEDEKPEPRCPDTLDMFS